jgi:hypothetical protein
MKTWEVELYWRTMELALTDLRVERLEAATRWVQTAEAENERLRWRKMKLENRLHKHVHRLIKRGWATL